MAGCLMWSGDSRHFKFFPFVPASFNMVRNVLWSPSSFCEMQTARGGWKTASNSCISCRWSSYWRQFLLQWFFKISVLHFDVQVPWSSVARTRERISGLGKATYPWGMLLPRTRAGLPTQGRAWTASLRMEKASIIGRGRPLISSWKQLASSTLHTLWST